MKGVTCEFTKMDWLVWELIEVRNKIKDNYAHCARKGSFRYVYTKDLKIKYQNLLKEMDELIRS